MNNKKKRFRQAAACFLAAALTISSGPGVFSPAAEESETVQELSETDTELTAGAAEESLTETSTEPETEEQTREEAPQEMETQERETETSAETETDPAGEPESQPDSEPDSEPETPEAENQTGQSEAGTEPQESMTEEESGSGAEGDESVSEGETPQEPVEEEPETKATEETIIPAETPAPATNVKPAETVKVDVETGNFISQDDPQDTIALTLINKNDNSEFGTSIWNEKEMRDETKEIPLAVQVKEEDWAKAYAGTYQATLTFTASLITPSAP